MQVCSACAQKPAAQVRPPPETVPDSGPASLATQVTELTRQVQTLAKSLAEDAPDQEGEGARSPTKAVEIRGRDGSVARQTSLPPLRGPTRGVGGALAALRVRADPRRQRLT